MYQQLSLKNKTDILEALCVLPPRSKEPWVWLLFPCISLPLFYVCPSIQIYVVLFSIILGFI